MIARMAAAAAAVALLAACGGDTEGRYDAQVDRVRDAVAAGDRAEALASLEEIGTSAFAAHAEGEITDEELFQLTGLVDTARGQVDAQLPEPPTTTTTAAPPSTEPAPAPVLDAEHKDDGEKGEKGEKDEKDRGRGRGGDDGGDDDDD